MFRQCIAIILTCVMGSVPGLCQEVSLSGTVTSSAGGAVTNARVTLLGSPLFATTNAQGMYQLTGAYTGVAAPRVMTREMTSVIRLSGGKLHITLYDEQTLRIDIFNLSGKKLANPVQGKLSAGTHTFVIHDDVLQRSVSILQITQGGTSHSYKLFGSSFIQTAHLSPAVAKSVAASYTLEASASGYATAQAVITELTGTRNFTLTPITTAATLYYDNTDSAISFAARHVQKVLTTRGSQATLKPLSELGIPAGSYIVIAKKDPSLLAKYSGQAVGALGEQDYALRVTVTNGTSGFWAIGGDRRGAMYGGIHLAEIVAGSSLFDVKNGDHHHYIENRGMKFNIPLDARLPSFDDGGDAAATNRDDIWDLTFWKEYLDVLALQRYNTLSLWNRHPFPTLVHVEKYNLVTMTGVKDRNGAMINNWTIAQKIAFWNQVLEHAYNRGIEVWPVVWNVELHGADGIQGISTAKNDPEAIEYLRLATEQLFISYPRLAGFGLAAGEKMSNYTDLEKEQYVYNSYGVGVANSIARFPGRKIRFVHRNWLTDPTVMEQVFSKLPVPYEFATKFAMERLYSHTSPTYAFKMLRANGGIPATRKGWWEMRNDDLFYQRWGDPDYVKAMILSFPHETKPCSEGPCLTAGFVLGSDRYLWARESMSKNPRMPLKQLENDKHWYNFLLWGRLAFDPNTSHDLLKGLIKFRFPSVDATSMFDAWRTASKILPMVVRFHYLGFDYMYYAERGAGNEWALPEWRGFHSIDDIIEYSNTQEEAGYQTIRAFANGTGTGRSPLVIADSLELNANAALTLAAGLSDNGNIELKETIGDIKSQSHFGLYWASKIRGGVSLKKFRNTKNSQDKTDAIAHLTKALSEWKLYAAQVHSSYNKVTIAGHHLIDLEAATVDVEADVTIARNSN